MGTPDFAVFPLRRLVEEGYNVVAVVTMPDKPSGRGQRLTPSAVKEYAVSVGLPVLQPEKLKAEAFVSEVRGLSADLGIVVAFRMLPEVIWSAPRLGTFNLHASLLPDYRGAAPINWAIINGDTMTGVTTFMLNHEIDCGAVLFRQQCPIDQEDTAGVLHDKLMAIGTDLVAATVDKIAAGDIVPEPQIESGNSRPAPKIFKNDCRIDWTIGGARVCNLIRGLSPYPAAWTEIIKDGTPIATKVYASHFEPSAHNSAIGTVSSDGKTHLKIATSDGYVFIDELQAAGKRRMKIDEFLRGFKL